MTLKTILLFLLGVLRLPVPRVIAITVVTFMLLANRYGTSAPSRQTFTAQDVSSPSLSLPAPDGRTLVYLPVAKTGKGDSKNALSATSEWMVLEVKVYPLPHSSKP